MVVRTLDTVSDPMGMNLIHGTRVALPAHESESARGRVLRSTLGRDQHCSLVEEK